MREYLIQENVRLLQQAEELLLEIADQTYVDSPLAVAPQFVGGHVRHVLEFYEMFFAGLDSGYIDYAARKRDRSLETDRGAALVRLREIAWQCRQSALTEVTRSDLAVRMEDKAGSVDDSVPLRTSVERELEVLRSHTTHHFAIVALLLRLHGVTVSPDFGVAPATLLFRASSAQPAAEGAVACAP